MIRINDEIEVLKRLIFNNIKKIPTDNISLFLSGGIDCSLVLAMIRKNYPDISINTFTLSTKEHPDYYNAKLVSDLFNTIHHNIILSSEEIDSLLKEYNTLFSNTSEGILNWYILCKYVKKYGNTVVTGDGGDECFGGYWLHEHPLGHNENGIITSYENIHHKPKQHLDMMQKMKLRNFAFKEKSEPADFNSVWEYYITVYEDEQQKPLNQIASTFNENVYSPLYSSEIVSFMRNQSYNLRINKYIERELAKEFLPEQIINRKKYNLPSALSPDEWLKSCK